jgi:hypothetical protein
VNFHGSGWHGEWAEGEGNDIHMFFNCRGLGNETEGYVLPLRYSYVFKTTETYSSSPVYRGHDYAGRQLKLVFEASYNVNDKREWKVRDESEGKLIKFEETARRADV